MFGKGDIKLDLEDLDVKKTQDDINTDVSQSSEMLDEPVFSNEEVPVNDSESVSTNEKLSIKLNTGEPISQDVSDNSVQETIDETLKVETPHVAIQDKVPIPTSSVQMSSNDFSLNMGGDEQSQNNDDAQEEIKPPVVEVETEETRSTPVINVQAGNNDLPPRPGPVKIDTDNLLPDDIDKYEKPQTLTKKKKEDIPVDVITNIAEQGVQMNEDFDIDQIKSTLYKNALGKQKTKKAAVYSIISIVIMLGLGVAGFFGWQNKDYLASIIKPKEVIKEVEVVKEVPIQQDVPEVPVEQQYNGGTLPLDSEAFEKMGVDKFYTTYKSDFDYIFTSHLPEKDKQNYLIDINLLIHNLNIGTYDYKIFRKKYNEIIDEVLTKVEK